VQWDGDRARARGVAEPGSDEEPQRGGHGQRGSSEQRAGGTVEDGEGGCARETERAYDEKRAERDGEPARWKGSHDFVDAVGPQPDERS